MKGGGHLGIAVGIGLVIFAAPVALLVGALSAAFHRGVSAPTFGLGIAWVCRWAFYGVLGMAVVGVLVIVAYINTQMTLFILWVGIAVMGSYLHAFRRVHEQGGLS